MVSDRLFLSKYVPEVDGLRALAIIPVVAFHQNIRGATLGWAGVHFFFVISGFLITGILLDSKGTSGYFRTFYARRALRIFPVYFLAFFSLLALAWVTGRPAGDWYYYATYTQNYRLALSGFEAQFPREFNHTWSLAVEEQYYLVWPAVVLLVSRRTLVAVCVALVVVAPLARWAIVASSGNTSMALASLVSCADTLAAGGLLAIGFRARIGASTLRTVSWSLVLVGLVLTCLVVIPFGVGNFWSPRYFLSEPFPNVFLYSFLAVFFCGAVGVSVTQSGWTTEVLRSRPLRHIGRISYGLYLYHWPILVWSPALWRSAGFETTAGGSTRVAAVVVEWVATYALALLSWRLVEAPFLSMKRRFARDPAD